MTRFGYLDSKRENENGTQRTTEAKKRAAGTFAGILRGTESDRGHLERLVAQDVAASAMTAKDIGRLPYPDRFYAAVDFVANPHPEAKALSDELRLFLFALHKQATQGPCNEPRPWSWNVVEAAKWQAWSQLGDMSKADAMRHYVQQLEQNQSDWWEIVDHDKAGNEAAAQVENGAEETALETEPSLDERYKVRIQKIRDATAEGSWSTPYLSNATKPLPRYEHGVALANNMMYVVGGNCAGGRYLNDVWSFDFSSLSWTSLNCEAKAADETSLLLPVAGHSLVHWRNSLLVIGGHVKSKDVTEKMLIRALDLESMEWSILKTEGAVPVSRGGHSATMIGDRLYVFGGEDVARRPLNDLHVLNLETGIWKDLSAVKNAPPSPRSAHVSVSYLDRYLIFFGGGSMATCFDDLVVYDVERRRWHSPFVKGRKPSPRAGHSATMLGNHWYIVGGGNNSSGCTDMAYLDFSQLSDWPTSAMTDDESEEDECPEGPDLDDIAYELRWSIVGTIPERSYLASEGMSLIAISEANVLVAFGGYNGRYSNAVSLFRPKEEETSLHPQYSVQSALSGRMDSETIDGTPHADADVANDQKIQSLKAKLDEVTKNAAAAQEATGQELALMRRQLVAAHAMLQEKDAALSKTKEQLTEQEGRTFKLQAEVAELQNKVSKMQELEKELELYRHKMPGAKAGGIWGWVAGE